MSGSQCATPALLDKEDGAEGKGWTSLLRYGWCLIHLGAGMVRRVAPSGTHIVLSDEHRIREGDRSCDHSGPRQSLVTPLTQHDLSQHSSCIPFSQLAPLWVLLPAVHCWEEEPHQPVQPGDPEGEQCVLPAPSACSSGCFKQVLFTSTCVSTHIFSTPYLQILLK